MSDERLTRIEDKLDKLSKVIADIVRVEERINASGDKISRLEHRMDVYENDFRDLKDTVIQNSSSMRIGERVVWICIAAAIGIAAMSFKV